MRHTDIAIIGGGLAGSTAAAMLGRAGIRATLIDPHPVYPEDFRCEKFDASQVALFHETGLADTVLPVTTPIREIWIAGRGRVLDKRPADQYGFPYDSVVNAVRRAIPETVQFVKGKAAAITTGPQTQVVKLLDGEEISARLVVLANGLNPGLRHALGIRRKEISQCHSISIGFDVGPVGREAFDFSALTYYPKRGEDRIAYLSMFPIATGTRANFFVYRDMRDPWLTAMRDTPHATVTAALPGLEALVGPFAVTDFVKIRPVDLYAVEGHRQDGIVLVGDAFGTSCPAAGTGTNKVLTDVVRLCGVHIPEWLATDGMGAAKIGAFYDDPVKLACDSESLGKAMRLRALSTGASFAWRARRLARLAKQFGGGAVRATRVRGERPASATGSV